MKHEDDFHFMSKALRLAKRGVGKVHPNPLVGAVLVKNNRIIGQGAHRKFGGPHAEREAILNAKERVAAATLYVTLEPCAHFGKTPPCADFILKNKIKKVVVAARDPNPLVNGRGLGLLKKKGVRVVTGVMEKEATRLNRDFNHWIRKKMPYVTVKIAQSLDGKIATKHGESRWITGDAARRFGHRLRAFSDAVLVGANTVQNDDPLLSVRTAGPGRQPLKIILDSYLRVSPKARLFSKESPGPVMIAVTRKATVRRKSLFRGKAEIVECREKNGKVDLGSLFRFLGRRGIVNLLVEGGGETVGGVLSEKLAHEVYFFVAPLIIGGKNAVTSVGGEGISLLRDAVKIKDLEVRRIGRDFMLHGTF